MSHVNNYRKIFQRALRELCHTDELFRQIAAEVARRWLARYVAKKTGATTAALKHFGAPRVVMRELITFYFLYTLSRQRSAQHSRQAIAERTLQRARPRRRRHARCRFHSRLPRGRMNKIMTDITVVPPATMTMYHFDFLFIPARQKCHSHASF